VVERSSAVERSGTVERSVEVKRPGMVKRSRAVERSCMEAVSLADTLRVPPARIKKKMKVPVAAQKGAKCCRWR
jgi:hypothetical protein